MNKATVISNIKEIASKTLPANSSLLLYGSRARGDNRPDSDWDLLILLDKPSLSFKIQNQNGQDTISHHSTRMLNTIK